MGGSATSSSMVIPTAEWQVGRALPGPRLMHEALLCGLRLDPTACRPNDHEAVRFGHLA